MRLVKTEQVTSDMKLARPIYHNHRILLNKGCRGLLKYVEKLKRYGVNYLYIEDKKSQDIKLNEAIGEQTRVQCKKVLAEAIRDITLNGNIDVDSIRKAVSDIMDDILSNQQVLFNLTDIKSHDDYTYAHSVNVTVISILLGKLLSYNPSQLLDLGTGALLHDIGKSVITPDILNKPGKLTDEEYEQMKQHPKSGFDMLKNNIDFSPLSRVVVLTHHERVDGSGYPHQLKEDQIHEFGRIAAVADVFDALTSDRVYREKWPIYQAVEYLTTFAGTLFDDQIVQSLVHSASIFPNGSLVTLSTGEKAVVKEQNSKFPTRPVVRIIEDKHGNECLKEINLMDDFSIVIL